MIKMRFIGANYTASNLLKADSVSSDICHSDRALFSQIFLIQHAHEQHGALRLSAYQALIPYLQYENIDKTYKKKLLSSINNLYERKTTELQTIHELVDVVNTETKRIFNKTEL